MGARPADHSIEARLLARGWRHVVIGQALVTLLMLPRLHIPATLTLAATVFNLLALANTRLDRNRAAGGGEPSATTARDLDTVTACIAGTSLCAVALAGWLR